MIVIIAWNSTIVIVCVCVYLSVFYLCHNRKTMSIITLTTDWSNDDFYVGAVKGKILSQCPDATIVDITHKIEGFKSAQAAFTLRGASRYFPEGTIHIVCVNSEVAEKKGNYPVCICHQGQYFIGADKPTFNMMFDQQPEKVYALYGGNGIIQSTFPELTIFAQAACLIYNNMPITELGDDITNDYRVLNLQPSVDDNSIVGDVVYIDSFGNAITNISRRKFVQKAQNRKFTIQIKNSQYVVDRICNTYSEVAEGELVAIFNSLGLLEIALNLGRFAELATVDTKTNVIIKFY